MVKKIAIILSIAMLLFFMFYDYVNAGGFPTRCDECEVKTLSVELDNQRTFLDEKDSTKLNMLMGNSKPGEAYLTYPGATGHKKEVDKKLTTSAKFTIYPTKNPSICFATGYFEFIAFDVTNASRKIIIYDLSFNPGAEVILGDKDYPFPLIQGYTMRGEGVKFILPNKDNLIGVVPIGNTVIEKAMKAEKLPEIRMEARPEKLNKTCEEDCELMFRKGELKQGMTVEECIKILCK